MPTADIEYRFINNNFNIFKKFIKKNYFDKFCFLPNKNISNQEITVVFFVFFSIPKWFRLHAIRRVSSQLLSDKHTQKPKTM